MNAANPQLPVKLSIIYVEHFASFRNVLDIASQINIWLFQRIHYYLVVGQSSHEHGSYVLWSPQV